MSPAKLQSLFQNAVAHHRAGRLTEAESVYRQARALAPRNFDVLYNSGLVAHQQGRLGEAVDFLQRAHKLEPKAALCEMRLGLALQAARRFTEAEAHLRHVVQTNPQLHTAWENLAGCLKAQDRLPEALACHQKAIALKPDDPAGWVSYGFTQRLAGQYREALVSQERALALDANFAPARFGRAQALQLLHRTHEAVADYERYLQLKPQSLEARSNRLFALQNVAEISREQLFAEHVAYGRVLGDCPEPAFPNAPEPERKLRLAILSPDLRAHSCAYFLEPLLQHLERDAFEVFLYADHFREDDVSARLRSLAATWRNFSGQSAATLEKTVRADAPDILLDLAGHTGVTNRLPSLARKLAPVQITYLGYPNTTGVKAIDYRFTDGIADPVGEADAFATEKLVRFAPTAWTYAPLAEAPDVAAPPCLKNGYITFGCFNDLAKITDRMMAVWGRILAAVPNSRLRLKGRGLSDGPTRAHYLERFARAGVAAERVDLLERTAGTTEHLAIYHTIDIALDTFPYHGTTTTCEALWMGLPVVSLLGDRHGSRVGASLLSAIGRSEWVASDVQRYIGIAAELAADPAALVNLRAGMRAELQRSPLLDHAGQAARFGAALRQCWSAWCERVAAPLAVAG